MIRQVPQVDTNGVVTPGSVATVFVPDRRHACSIGCLPMRVGWPTAMTS